MGKWRQPKATNKNALKRIAAGDMWWNHKAIERAEVRRKQRRMMFKAAMAAKKRWESDCAKGIQGCRVPTNIIYIQMFGFPLTNKGYNS